MCMYVAKWRSHSTHDGQFSRIIAIGSGNLKMFVILQSVPDYGQNCIITFSLDENCSGRYGTQGTGRGQLKDPCSVAVCLASSLLLSMVIAVYQSLTKMVSLYIGLVQAAIIQ